MLSLIVAIARGDVIGRGNKLPWHYKEDLQYFKETTTGKTVLMGLETFHSIVGYLGKPLPNRHSVVASLEPFNYPGVDVTQDVFDYIKHIPNEKEVFVIGGKTIYELLIPYCDRLYITHIDKEYEGDVLLTIDYSQFHLVNERQSGELRFAIYERLE